MMEYCMFAVDTTPYCVWELDLQSKNIEFLDNIDFDYFKYASEVHFENLEGEHSKRAAISLRTSYHHGLETLFLMIGAAIQAPEAVHAYALKCFPKDLRSIIKKLNDNSDHLYNKHGLQFIGWREICERIFVFSNPSPDRAEDTTQRYMTLWKRFGNDFLKDLHIKEYNSIKHGFRARSGGFGLTFAKEVSPGILPPDPKFFSLGKSEHGTHFFSDTSIASGAGKNKDVNFTTVQHSVAWAPEELACALQLISLSIQNVIAYIKILNGMKPQEVLFTRPEEGEYFEKPWTGLAGIISFSSSFQIKEEDVICYTRPEVIEALTANINSANEG